MAELTLDNLVAGLETFSDRYQALDVFIADVAEIRSLADGAPVPGLRPEPETESSFEFEHETTRYHLQLFVEDGVARLTRAVAVPQRSATTGAGVGAAVGPALGAAVASKRQPLEGAAAGLLLGLLVGAALGAAGAEAPPARKVFTLCFDPALGQWRAYDGGLVRWMKSRLAPPNVLAGLPQ